MTLVMGHPDPAFSCRVVPTYVDASRPRQLLVGVQGMLRSSVSLLRGEVDLLHVHLAKRGSLVRKAFPLLAARVKGVPAVVHGHSFDFILWFDQLPGPVKAVARQVLHADHWLVLGTSFAREYARALEVDPDRIEVLINPVDLDIPATYDSGVAPDGRVHVLSLGRLGEGKGSFDMVEALAGMPAHVRDRVHLTIAGDGEVDAVAEAVARAGLHEVVTLPGWVGPQERGRLLEQSSIFVLPSHGEGLPMSMLEAMAAGKAVVITPVGGVPDVIEDGVNGILVPIRDPEAVASALQRLVEDEELRLRLGQQARRTAEQHSLAAWYTRLGELWHELVGR